MNRFVFFICFVVVPLTFGDNPISQNALELDRSRSAWNFGGHQPVKKAAYWNRPKNVAGPSSFLTNRRLGSASTPMAPYKKKPRNAAPAATSGMKRRQQQPSRPNGSQVRPVSKRNAFPFLPSSTFQQISHYNKEQSHRKPASPWYRQSRKLRPTVDSIKNRFMKEDLWHLDKGESYIVNDDDLERDSLYRNRHNENNNIDQEDINLQKQLEQDTEKSVVNGDKNAPKENINTNPRSVIHHHHHHHYDWEKTKGKRNAKGEMHNKKPAGAEPQKMFSVPLPRIHNPIPLGCLLAVPVFHPIRPRHHLACLLSIPGTPSLTRRRRKRSTDLPQINISTPGQSKSMFERLFGSNSGMTPIITRKHYSNHVGNGKNQNIPSSQPGNYKLPATIIAPPQFEKDDVLTMLLGSGGISAEKMGTVVATNNRYVRYGRELPVNGGNTRQGRHLQWMSGSSATRNPIIPSPAKVPPSTYAKNPVLHLTPSRQISSPVYVSSPPPPKAFLPVTQLRPSNPSPSLILNVQINPLPPPVSSGSQTSTPLEQHITTVEQVQQQEHQYQPNVDLQSQQRSAELLEKQQNSPEQIVSVSPSGTSHKLKNVKYAEWIPVYLGGTKHKNVYHEDSLNENYNASESKLLYRKIKPIAEIQNEPEPENVYHESTNERNVNSSDDNDVAASFVTFSDYHDNGLEFNTKYENSDDFGDSGNHPLYPSWKDQDKLLVKSLSFAVKKSYKENLNRLLQKISNRERGAYTDSSEPLRSLEAESNDSYNNNMYSSSSGGADSSSIYDSVGKYYSAKKVPDHLPDPIFINVPKDNNYLSTTLYDAAKK